MKSKLNAIANWAQEQMNKAAYQKKTPTYGTAEVDDIPYLNDGSPDHLLDVYAPQLSKEKLPVIVTVHGGGYVSNRKVCNRPHGQWLAAQGFKVVNVEYTLIPQATLAEELAELTAVFSWVESHAEEYGFDVNNLFLLGDSSGGHLALLMAALQTNPALQKQAGLRPVASGIRAVGATCPVGSFRSKDPVSLAMRLLFQALGQKDLAPYSMENFLTKEMIDCMLITSPTDIGIHTVTHKIHQELEKKGVDHVYFNLKGKTHKLPHVFNVLYLDWEESVEANQALLQFFRSKMVK